MLLALLLAGSLALQGQVLRVDPVFPTAEDTVTIIYNAAEGNAALLGVSPVYPHTGVITNLSAPGSWRYVKWDWAPNPPERRMESLGNNLHRMKFHLRSFYGVPQNERIEQMAFVFRNADGSRVGRAADGSDIFYPVYEAGILEVAFLSPQGGEVVQAHTPVPVEVAASDSATLKLYVNDSLVAQAYGKSLIYEFSTAIAGNYWLKLHADNGSLQKQDSLLITVRQTVTVENPPAGLQNGLHYLNDSTVRLALYAPEKSFIYVIGDFNDWMPVPQHLMKVSEDGTRFWLEISGLQPGRPYAYQYLIDGSLRLADPYAELVLDPWNDRWISNATYPNLPSYPEGKTSGIVSVLQTGQQPYSWQVNDFQRPEKGKLVIYELLLRDFLAAHDFSTLTDTLDYLQRLGVNAIELMPVMEFEGNESWGYNPSFYFAVDKYYGPKETLKRFIDECHARGIAVILDMVLNHAFGQCPLVQMYWDAAQNRPAENSPWFNPVARHPFNVGFDFNHESPATQEFVDQVMNFWLSEYRFDGFRMDLSKGFTQQFTTDVGQWSQYDASRIALLNRMGQQLWASDTGAYLILEHFGDNREEKELSDAGFMLWGNLNYNYNEASMGYVQNSDFSWISYQRRGWDDPHVVGYMESHDEERLMFKNLQYGNASGSYNVKQLPTALARMELAAALFFPVPGPKMLWQFGELGYDVSIDDPCRLCNKPIRWEYFSQPARRQLYEVFAQLIHLKTTYPAFLTTDYTLSAAGALKELQLRHPSMNVLVWGNFDVEPQTFTPVFPHTGWWYDFFEQDSILITGSSGQLTFAPGEYHLFTDVRLDKAQITATHEPLQGYQLRSFPNPFEAGIQLQLQLARSSRLSLEVLDLHSRRLTTLQHQSLLPAGTHNWTWDGRDQSGRPLPPGCYLYRLLIDGRPVIGKWLKQ